MQEYINKISQILSLTKTSVENTIKLLEEKSTIPFIARYRKEMTGGLDELQIADIQSTYQKLLELEQRKQFIVKTIEKLGKLTPELEQKIIAAEDINLLEDLYLPYKVKKKSKADVARELGLGNLANALLRQDSDDVESMAKQYLSDKVKTTSDALSGARDIIAEIINENLDCRNIVREIFESHAYISAKVVKTKIEEAAKFKDYFDYKEKLSNCPSHRLLAIRRGEAEGYLKVKIEPNPELVMTNLQEVLIINESQSAMQVNLAVEDCYNRLLSKSIESEFAKISKEIADVEAIKVFTNNLRQLLLAPPLGNIALMSIDPGFRTGCKVVVLDELGNLITHLVIFPEATNSDVQVKKLIQHYNINTIALGDGTASRETESFLRKIDFEKEMQIFMINEDGASIYSASEIAREEFPNHDVTVKGAVSIGRRLQDPLAELVKLDPKSIGVGQYQHDVDQKLLKQSLDNTVESCVNMVGVDLNTASKYLLTYVSGLNSKIAKSIIEYRNENGKFVSRKQLMKVKGLGTKAYEQCAGFMRIVDGKNPLDNSAVHPESYIIVEKIAKDLGVKISELIANKTLIGTIVTKNYITEKIGMPTLVDILEELTKPSRDPRGMAKQFKFAENIHKIEDLTIGMVVPGIVTNITNFGAFVDIGVHCDGLLHISEISDTYISDVNTVLSLNQELMTKITDIDLDRKRISLTLKDLS
jgi:protein Tex